MENRNHSPKRGRHSGGKVAGGAVLLALLLAGGHFGLGIGRDGGGLLTGEGMKNAAETVTQSAEGTENAVETAAETAEKLQETAAESVTSQDDGVLTITVKQDMLLYEGQETTLAQLEENLLKDFKAESSTVELKDDHAIKAAYDEVTALLQKLNIPFTTEN